MKPLFLRAFLVLLLIPQIAFAGYFRGPDSIYPAATRAIFPLLPAASGESTLRRAARPSIIDETPDARTGQGEAQAAQARLDNKCITFSHARSAEQPGGWGLTPQHDEYMPSGELWQNSTDSRYELARRFLFTGKELDSGRIFFKEPLTVQKSVAGVVMAAGAVLVLVR